ncbi:MAG: hypothetical protein MUC77_03880 [Chromatiaceae bacterium]|jgi:hypothetical protein|nr:hypothetical protein [Chromatiaceae bacterium]
MSSRTLALLFGLVLTLCTPFLAASDSDTECDAELQAILEELIDFVDQPAFRAFVTRLSADERQELMAALAEVVEGALVAHDAECGPRVGGAEPGPLRRVGMPIGLGLLGGGP